MNAQPTTYLTSLLHSGARSWAQLGARHSVGQVPNASASSFSQRSSSQDEEQTTPHLPPELEAVRVAPPPFDVASPAPTTQFKLREEAADARASSSPAQKRPLLTEHAPNSIVAHPASPARPAAVTDGQRHSLPLADTVAADLTTVPAPHWRSAIASDAANNELVVEIASPGTTGLSAAPRRLIHTALEAETSTFSAEQSVMAHATKHADLPLLGDPVAEARPPAFEATKSGPLPVPAAQNRVFQENSFGEERAAPGGAGILPAAQAERGARREGDDAQEQAMPSPSERASLHSLAAGETPALPGAARPPKLTIKRLEIQIINEPPTPAAAPVRRAPAPAGEPRQQWERHLLDRMELS